MDTIQIKDTNLLFPLRTGYSKEVIRVANEINRDLASVRIRSSSVC